MMTTSLWRGNNNEKIKLGTSDGATENAKRITELFLQVVTEIKTPTVKSNVLLTLTPYETFLVMWSKVSVSVYQFTWPGKRGSQSRGRASPHL